MSPVNSMSTAKMLGVLLFVGAVGAIQYPITTNNYPTNTNTNNLISTPNSYNTNGNPIKTPSYQPKHSVQQWNGYENGGGGGYDNGGGGGGDYYETPRYYRNTHPNQYQSQPQYQYPEQQRYSNAYEDDQPQYRNYQQPHYPQYQQFSHQNPPYYGHGGENHRQNHPSSYSDDEDESGSQYSIPMMEPIRRMYHVYEDNVRGFAKRFRNMVYAPMRMMG